VDKQEIRRELKQEILSDLKKLRNHERSQGSMADYERMVDFLIENLEQQLKYDGESVAPWKTGK